MHSQKQSHRFHKMHSPNAFKRSPSPKQHVTTLKISSPGKSPTPLQRFWWVLRAPVALTLLVMESEKATLEKTMQPFMLWCLDVLVVRPMLIFTEIAGADLCYYEEKLSKFYGMWPIKVDPFDAGLPLRRVRLYVFMWCKLRASFSGSEKEYVGLTRRKVMMKGEDLMCGDDDMRWKISRDNAERHGYVYGQVKQSEDFPVIPLQHQVTAQTFQRYQDQVRQYETK